MTLIIYTFLCALTTPSVRNVRVNIVQLVQFQNEYSFTQLSIQNQKMDLNNQVIAFRNVHHGVKK